MRLIDADDIDVGDISCFYGENCRLEDVQQLIDDQPTIDAVIMMHGKWIECDYKYLEHGMLETEPNAGFCCSNCRAAFRKKNMTYKQFCAACGARMDLTEVD